MPQYQEHTLAKVVKDGDKTGGKNKNEVNGFYQSEQTGETFFVKQPNDKKELFTELFAGLLLKQFVQRIIKKLIEKGKLPQGADKSLIFADWMRFDDGSYGLIQPKVSFIELYKIIGTGYKDNSDRDPLWDMINGPSAYPLLTANGQYFGLSLSIMFSLLFCACSVHSANIVRLTPENAHPLEETISQFARIDWGDAFRNFAHEKNNKDILSPSEYEGFLNYKKFTKDYIKNYRNLIGLFTSTAEKGRLVSSVMKESNSDLMLEMVKQAFSEMPADLLPDEIKKKLAAYLGIPEFATVTFGKEGNYAGVADKFTEVLNSRLNQITELKERVAPNSEGIMYQSIINTKAVTLLLTEEDNFSNFITNLEENLHLANHNLLDFSQIDLTQLAERFNYYIDVLAHQTEVTDCWTHSPDNNNNLLAKYYKRRTDEVLYGHAFVPQYRESTILRNLSSLNLKKIGPCRFKPYEEALTEYHQTHSEFDIWKAMEDLSAYGVSIIGAIRGVKKQQQEALIDRQLNSKEHMEPVINGLKDTLQKYKKSCVALNELLKKSNINPPLKFESNFFYPISDEELNMMHGVQLITVCFEELNDKTPSALLFRILKNDKLWKQVNSALTEHGLSFDAREDNIKVKITSLIDLREKTAQFYEQLNLFKSTSALEDKKIVLQELSNRMGLLPQTFQDALIEIIKDAQEETAQLGTYKLKYDAFQISEDKVSDFTALRSAYLALPVHLRDVYQIEYYSSANNVWQLLLAKFGTEIDVPNYEQELTDKIEQFAALEKFFNELAPDLKKYYNYDEVFTQQKQIFEFYNSLNIYKTEPNNLSEKVDTFVKINLESSKNINKAVYEELCKKNKIYKTISDNDLSPGYTPITEVNEVLNKLPTLDQDQSKTFMDVVLQDKHLWEAIKNTKIAKLPKEIIDDLLALHTFRDAQLLINQNNKHGNDYTTSINSFYSRSINIRLSEKSIKEQSDSIINTAQEEFGHRHSTRRLVADVIMLVGILFAGLGLIIGVGRALSGRTFFFSSMPTDRQAELANWVQKPELDNERLIVAPVA